MSKVESKFRECKVSIGDFVHYPKPDLYGMTRGKVYEIDRLYKQLDRFGKFEKGGLCIDEDSIKSIQIPHKMENGILTIEYPQSQFSPSYTRQYKLYAYSVSCKNERMNTCFVDTKLKKLA